MEWNANLIILLLVALDLLVLPTGCLHFCKDNMSQRVNYRC